MAEHKNYIRRAVAAAAFAAAAVATPVIAATWAAPTPGSNLSQPECLAHFGNIEDNLCLGYSNGTPAVIGTPEVGYCGNGSGSCSNRFGVSTGPLLPGKQIGGNFSPGSGR